MLVITCLLEVGYLVTVVFCKADDIVTFLVTLLKLGPLWGALDAETTGFYTTGWASLEEEVYGAMGFVGAGRELLAGAIGAGPFG